MMYAWGLEVPICLYAPSNDIPCAHVDPFHPCLPLKISGNHVCHNVLKCRSPLCMTDRVLGTLNPKPGLGCWVGSQLRAPHGKCSHHLEIPSRHEMPSKDLHFETRLLIYDPYQPFTVQLLSMLNHPYTNLPKQEAEFEELPLTYLRKPTNDPDNLCFAMPAALCSCYSLGFRLRGCAPLREDQCLDQTLRHRQKRLHQRNDPGKLLAGAFSKPDHGDKKGLGLGLYELYRGNIGILENEMETTIMGYKGII